MTQPRYFGDLEIIARYLDPSEAHVLCSCLEAAGVPVQRGDVNTVQADWGLTIAMGGACVRVPREYKDEALALLRAIRQGDFELDDDAEVGEPVP